MAKKNFLIIDASMTELIRPCLYGAKHSIVLLKQCPKHKAMKADNVDIVGPVCESGDYLGKDRKIFNVQKDDWLAILHCGAYGSVMCSNYNSRPQAMEILIDNDNNARIIKSRQTFADMLKAEKCKL